MAGPKKTSYRPWIPDLILGTGFFVVGVSPLLVFWQTAVSRPIFITICLASCAIGVMILGKVWARYRGTLVEKRSIRWLRLPSGWRKESNVPVGKGDLDLLVVGPENKRFAVEIKSYQGIQLRRSSFGKTEELRYRDGRAFSRDPVNQVLRAAEHTNALPVLWLPEAKSAKVIRMKCGVTVVQGGGGDLLRAIGAKGWF